MRIGHFLEDTAADTLRLKPLPAEYRQVFIPLVMATAWQESCWRQYVVRKDKRWPIKSQAGAVGIMQVMPRVWRGFYDRHALSWDISYNASAGSEILHHYLVKHAIRKKEHEKTGDLHNLARASYALYNGGPRQLRRYRSESATPSSEKSSSSRWSSPRPGNARLTAHSGTSTRQYGEMARDGCWSVMARHAGSPAFPGRSACGNIRDR